MRKIREVVDILGGPFEVLGAAVICLGTCVMLILASAIWG